MSAKRKPGGYAEIREQLRIPPPIAVVKPFFQRRIRRFVTKRVDGVLLIHAAELSCGHTHTYRRRQPSPSKRTTAPCEQCGAGLRRTHEEARDTAWRQRAISALLVDQAKHPCLVRLIDAGMDAATLQPLSQQAEDIYQRIHTAAMELDLLDRPTLAPEGDYYA